MFYRNSLYKYRWVSIVYRIISSFLDHRIELDIHSMLHTHLLFILITAAVCDSSRWVLRPYIAIELLIMANFCMKIRVLHRNRKALPHNRRFAFATFIAWSMIKRIGINIRRTVNVYLHQVTDMFHENTHREGQIIDPESFNTFANLSIHQSSI